MLYVGMDGINILFNVEVSFCSSTDSNMCKIFFPG